MAHVYDGNTYITPNRSAYVTPALTKTDGYMNYTWTFTSDVTSVTNWASSDNSSEIQEEINKTSVDEYLWMYFSPFILIFGLCGNILTLAVMCRKRLRGTTTSVYMPVMAVFDTIAVAYGIAPEWFKACNIIRFREVHPILCKLEKFIFYTSSDTAIWVLVLFTVDRFVAVCFPLQKNRICVPRRAKGACIIVFVCSVVKNLHVFWTRGAEYYNDGRLKDNCGKPEPYRTFETDYRPWIAFALISVVPFCILLFCNCIIIYKLTQTRNVQMRKMDSSTDRSSTFKQTTMMCLSVSFVFLICVIPSIVLVIGKPHWEKNNPSYEVAKAVSNQLAYFNHSVNFFLYCLTGQKFRTELVAMLVSVRQSIFLQDSDIRTSHTVVTRSTIPLAAHAVNFEVIDPLRTRAKTHQACQV